MILGTDDLRAIERILDKFGNDDIIALERAFACARCRPGRDAVLNIRPAATAGFTVHFWRSAGDGVFAQGATIGEALRRLRVGLANGGWL